MRKYLEDMLVGRFFKSTPDADGMDGLGQWVLDDGSEIETVSDPIDGYVMVIELEDVDLVRDPITSLAPIRQESATPSSQWFVALCGEQVKATIHAYVSAARPTLDAFIEGV